MALVKLNFVQKAFRSIFLSYSANGLNTYLFSVFSVPYVVFLMFVSMDASKLQKHNQHFLCVFPMLLRMCLFIDL